MINAIEAHNKVAHGAPALREKRFKATCEIGKGIRQGDLYIIRVEDTGHTKIKGLEQPVMVELCTMLGSDQLAPGTTQGSRHTIKEGQATYWVDPKNTNPIFGGIIKANCRWDLEHPEHAHWNMPEGTYAVFYQLDWQTKQRVKD